MIKLIGKSGNFFLGIPIPKICSISENLVRHVFPKKYQNSIFFRVLLFVFEEHRKNRIIVNFDAIW